MGVLMMLTTAISASNTPRAALQKTPHATLNTPSPQAMSNTTAVLARSLNRFSASHDTQHTPPPDSAASPKRASKLNDIMSRGRTASLPPRPHTSSGTTLSPRQKLTARLGNLKGKGKDRGEDGVDGGQSLSSRAASSVTSVADPFAAQPSSASFVTYSPIAPSQPPALTMRPQTAESSANASPAVYSPPNSPTLSSPPSQLYTSPPRRRGSILLAASDALSSISSIARKAPMRSLQLNMSGLGRQGNGKGSGIMNPSQPIVLTEVIEISESAIRASKVREEEERERERLRDAAARALGIGEGVIDSSSSLGSRRRPGFSGLDDNESPEDEGSNVDQDAWDDAITPTATISPSLPIPLATHSRSRSGSYIPPLNSLVPSHRPSTPLSASQSNLPPTRTHSAKSLSTPPALTAQASPLALNIRNTSRARTEQDPPPTPLPEIPSFPSTPGLLAQFVQRAGTIPRYYPAPSLLMFTLSKQWKNRYLVLTSPIQPPQPASQFPSFSTPWSSRDASAERGPGTTPLPWYLHLFKSSAQDEKELERLEINEESVVYVADGEVGGRRGVIKVGGLLHKKLALTSPRPSSSGASTAIASRTSSSSMGSADDASEGWSSGTAYSDAGGSSQSTGGEGRTMWVLQIIDPEEAKGWIGAIKGSVLSQRSIRAGLGVPTVMNSMEPRGDLDVVLSMRAQGLLSSAISPLQRIEPANAANGRAQSSASPTQSSSPSDGSPTSLLSRPQSANGQLHSVSAAASASASAENSPVAPSPQLNAASSPAPRAPISATTALKSLFTIGGGRPRSPSTVSYAPPPPSPTVDTCDTRPEDSFGHAGSSLMGLMRTNSYVTDRPLSPTVSVCPTPRVGTPIIPCDAQLHLLERKILPDSDRHLVEHETAGEPILVKRANANGPTKGIPRDFDDRPIIPGRVSSDGIMSPSLQPPPRKRAGTVNTFATSAITVDEPATYSYSHANGSTAESLGIPFGGPGSSLLAPSPPLADSSLPHSGRPKDRRTRTSWSSISTYGSNDQSPSPDDAKPRRWSRRSSLTHRISSPYPPRTTPPSSPKSPFVRTPSMQHPYASEGASLSRSSSGSGQSRVSELHNRRFSKRASGSSVHSFSTGSTTQGPSGMAGGRSALSSPKPRSAHRASAPPPQRPAPNSALPPTPFEEDNSLASDLLTQPIPIPKSSFRESFTMRGKRLSATPPTLPPSSVLPPRPDELAYRAHANGHRRSSSQGNPNESTSPSSFSTFRSSPTRGRAPFPPPNTPLPAPPNSSPVMSAPSSPTRPVSNIKRRFRILSSPPSSAHPALSLMTPLDIPTSLSFNPYAIPESPIRPVPIGEPITTMQNDPSFLMMSPPTPSQLSPSPLPIEADLPGLSPPPRRSSRQVATPDVEKLQMEIEPSVEAVLATAHDDDDIPPSPPAAPPSEVDDFASLLTPTVRSSDHSAVSLVDIRI